MMAAEYCNRLESNVYSTFGEDDRQESERGQPRCRTLSRRKMSIQNRLLTHEERQNIAVELSGAPPRPTDIDRCPVDELGSDDWPFCPWVGCRYHLYLDAQPSGSIKFYFPGLEVWELPETCALHVARKGQTNNADIGALLNVTRERVRQLLAQTIDRLRDMPVFREINAKRQES